MSTVRVHGLERTFALGARHLRGGVAFVVATAVAFFFMALDRRVPLGAYAATLALAIAAAGLVHALGEQKDASVARHVDARAVLLALAGSGASAIAFFVALALVARGAIPQAVGGALVTASFVGVALFVYRTAARLEVFADDRPLVRRHGFWIVTIAALVYLPTLGFSSLWDPWESHYGEVAREILTRDDWISLWWSRDGFFYSKPVLAIWLEALTMVAVRFDPSPDHVLGHGQHPEWILRAPNAVLSIVALYALYRAVSRVHGRRAGALGALVLGTSPFWVLLAHQAITDMTLVALASISASFVLFALESPEDAVAPARSLRVGGFTLTISLWHLVFAGIVLAALPQALYLVSRNLEVVAHGAGAHGLRPHLDAFLSGSPGNCTLPGNSPCQELRPAFPRVQPWMLGAASGSLLVAFSVLYGEERRVRRLYFLAAWLFAALAALAKGPAGIAFPGLVALAHVAVTRRFRDLLHLELLGGALLVAMVTLPWYVASYLRHGSAFTDELLFHDMLNRAFSHVHDTNEGEDVGLRYYLGQLGYGLFPWTGFALFAAVPWMRPGEIRARLPAVLSLWALSAFTLFSLMGTKFHHYIFPAVPAIALLAGIGLDRLLGEAAPPFASRGHAEHAKRMAAALVLGATTVLVLVGRDLVAESPAEFPGAIRLAQLFSYQYHRAWPETVHLHASFVGFVAVAVAASLLAALAKTRRLGVALFGGVAVVWAAWCTDVYLLRAAPHWGQGEIARAYYRLRQGDGEPLVAYRLNYKGENFYTGNHVAVFVDAGAPFAAWVKQEKERGVHVMYFVTERPQVGGLRGELRGVALREVTTPEDSRQFVLFRGEL